MTSLTGMAAFEQQALAFCILSLPIESASSLCIHAFLSRFKPASQQQPSHSVRTKPSKTRRASAGRVSIQPVDEELDDFPTLASVDAEKDSAEQDSFKQMHRPIGRVYPHSNPDTIANDRGIDTASLATLTPTEPVEDRQQTASRATKVRIRLGDTLRRVFHRDH
ncbi:hypothetical protein BC831DRAFT_506014 [Entophlyctis helioformis]|nr:hypothetical protein BC831DRAFT_506014 [Entophlyctis helioformis]